MSSHDDQGKKDLPARDQVADPLTPQQAEGDREVVEAQLSEGSDPLPDKGQPDAHRTPGKAEGSEATVEAQLNED